MLALVILKAQATALWPAWLQASAPAAAAVCIAGLVQCFMVPWVRQQVHKPILLPARPAKQPLDSRQEDAVSLELSSRSSGKGDEEEVTHRPWAPEALPAL